MRVLDQLQLRWQLQMAQTAERLLIPLAKECYTTHKEVFSLAALKLPEKRVLLLADAFLTIDLSVAKALYDLYYRVPGSRLDKYIQ